jgi:pimeloyl-ACP methyl ester carboxylesterase
MDGQDALSCERREGAAGLPLVLLHAFPFDRRMWEPQVSALEGSRELHVPDMLGFGSTPLPEGTVGLERQADAVVRCLDATHVTRAAFCGLSMGGYIALALAERHPDRVAALILADTRATADSEAVRLNRTATAERVLREGVAGLAEEMIPKLLGAATRLDKPQIEGLVRSIMTSQRPETVAAALIAMRDRPDRTEALRILDCPVLVVVGEEDVMTPPEEARSMAELCRDGRLTVLPGASHLANLDVPEGFSGIVREFLAGL